MKLSIVVPTLNEEQFILECLNPLQALRRDHHELILADGGSQDRTVEFARPLCDHIVTCPAGRATQMNLGAAQASGDVLMFLHADTEILENADVHIRNHLKDPAAVWGRFDVRLSGTKIIFRLMESLINIRSRITGIATGDQAIFVRREVFQSIGGYKEIPLMEDIELCRLLNTIAKPECIHTPVRTSSRRWEKQGILRTILLMWCLRIRYFLGESPHSLARRYQCAR